MDVLKELVTSKKLIAALIGVVVALAARLGLDLSTEDVALVVAPIVAFVLGQGLADLGKSAALAKVKLLTGELDQADGSEAETGRFPRLDAPSSPPAESLRRGSSLTPTTGGLGSDARRLREEARSRTPPPLPLPLPLPPPPRDPERGG
jgi:hypothetical protein